MDGVVGVRGDGLVEGVDALDRDASGAASFGAGTAGGVGGRVGHEGQDSVFMERRPFTDAGDAERLRTVIYGAGGQREGQGAVNAWLSSRG